MSFTTHSVSPVGFCQTWRTTSYTPWQLPVAISWRITTTHWLMLKPVLGLQEKFYNAQYQKL